MSMIINKYPLEIKNGVQEIEVPIKSGFQSVAANEGVLSAYFIIHDKEKKMIPVKFFIGETGKEIPSNILIDFELVGTIPVTVFVNDDSNKYFQKPKIFMCHVYMERLT